MKKLFALMFLAGLLSGTISSAQTGDDAILMTINSEPVTKGEFVRIYSKNNTGSQEVDPKSLEEYLQLFINFKLKVAEARALGLDTVQSFVSELSGYRKQLARPYLIDQDVDQQTIREAYERLQWDVKASHILIQLDQKPTPADTLAAWNKIMNIRKRVVKGEDFHALAAELSQDPSAKSNSGRLGYFTGFQMVFPFEEAAYNTPVGQVSLPVRTRFGYHLILVNDKRPASGKVKAAHLMISVPDTANPETDAQARNRINQIYSQLKEGADFAELVRKYSDDKASASRGGELPVFGTGKMVPEFEEAAFSLQNPGDFSKPVRTNYGYHIIRLIEKQGVEPFEKMESEIKSRIQRDDRANRSRQALIAQLKKEYVFTENKSIRESYYKVVTDSLLNGSWDGESAQGRTGVLFTLHSKPFTEADFTTYLMNLRSKSNLTLNDFLTQQYTKWVDQSIIDYEDSRLEAKYPEFRYLMNEYHDGILLFELSDQMVWSKAVKDTVGLNSYYEQHKNNYMWEKRLDLSIYRLSEIPDTSVVKSDFSKANQKVVRQVKAFAKKRLKKPVTREEALTLCNQFITKNRSNYRIEIQEMLAESKDFHLIEKVTWAPGVYGVFEEPAEKVIVAVNRTLEPEPKALKEVKGLITAGYQNYLETEWIRDLRNRYKVDVNQDLLNSIR
jgi:peptidyl-prolyl cis-trans isomerase SurA